LSGRKKAAILLACLGPENASRIMAGLTDEEVEQMTLDISSLGTVDADLKAGVLDEFFQMAVAKRFVAQGGIDLAKNLLEKSFGSERAFEILNRLQSSLQ